MKWNKIFSMFKKKTAGTELGGFELLARLTSKNWSKKKMLQQYEKSLYVFACVNKIAEKCSSIDLELYQILNSSGDNKEIISHEALDLLYKVNPFQTKTEFMKITVINLRLAGDAFWVKIRNNGGKVAELWNLRPDLIEIVKDPNEYIKGYKFTKSAGEIVFFAPDDIVHFKSPTPLDDYYGISPVKSASIRIETEAHASEYQRDFFLNNARPDAIVKAAGNLTPRQKKEMRENFELQHKGKGKNSKLGIFEGGLDYQQISISQREMDYIESMKFTRDDILVAFHTPKPIVAITDDVNYANANTAMYIFLSETIKPLMGDIVEKINEELISPDFGENLYLDFPDPTPEMREQTLKDYENGSKNHWLLINEIRQKEGLEPIDGGWDLYMPLNNVASGGLKQTKRAKTMEDWAMLQNKKTRIKAIKTFRGKRELRQRFFIAEQFKKELTKTLKAYKVEAEAEAKAKAKVAKKLKPLIKGEDLRNKYFAMVNKSIDQKAAKLKEDVIKLATAQEAEFIAKLAQIDDLTKSKALGKNANAEIKNFYAGQEAVWAEFIFPFIEDYTRSAGLDAMLMVNPETNFEMTDAVRKVLKKRAAEFGLGVNKTTREKITKAINTGLAEGESMAKISNRVNDSYKEFSTYRADLIARTEATAANNEGFIEAYKQSGVATHKEWIATKDDRTRDEHLAMNGEIVKVNKKFSNGLMYPKEPNCRCVIGPALDD